MRLSTSISFLFLSAVVGFAAVGCAGANGNDEDTASTTADIDTEENLPPASAAPMLDAEEIAFVNALNAYRKEKGVSGYDEDGNEVRGAQLHVAVGLVKAARKHSTEMADIRAVNATHNDRGRSDQGSLREEAKRATQARIAADYSFRQCQPGDTPCGSSWGEDCARRPDIGSGVAAFNLLKTNLAGREGFSTHAYPTDAAPGPNMLDSSFTAIGVARARSASGVWYWTVTYGDIAEPTAPMLALDDGTDQSLLSNGSFERAAKTSWGEPTIGKGAWNMVKTWYGPHDPALAEDPRLQKWHIFATGGGTAEVRADSAYFADDASARAHGLRMVDSDHGHTTATQIVAAVPGVNYELSARTRKLDPSNSQQAIFLDFIDKNYDRIGFTKVKAGGQNSWLSEPIRVSATAPLKTAYVRVILYSTNAAGHSSTYDWDDVRLRAW